MDKPYFVMIYDQHGGALVMSDNEDFYPTFFATWKEANAAGAGNLLAKACGYEVHCMGDCVACP